MIMNNENKELSRNRNRIIERKIQKDNKMKLLFNNIKSEKKNKNINIDESKYLEIELVKAN